MPVPPLKRMVSNRGHKPGSSAVWTSSPSKTRLEDSLLEGKQKLPKAPAKSKKKREAPPTKPCKKRLKLSEDSDEEHIAPTVFSDWLEILGHYQINSVVDKLGLAMGLFLESWLSEFLAVALVVVAAVYARYSYCYSYWSKKGVPQAPTVIQFGNAGRVFLGLTRLEFMFRDLYFRFRDHRYVGVYMFTEPGLLLIDRDLFRLVFVKEFDAFSHRNINFDEKQPLNHHLFNLNGERWKRMRAKMSPAFTTGKLKMMFQTMQDCGRELVEVLHEPAKRGEILEMREIAARFTTDVIASVGFGVECHAQRNPDTEFRQWGRKIFEPTLKTRISSLMYRFFPAVAKALQLKNSASGKSGFFRKMVEDTVEYREQHGVVRNDFLQLMMQLKNKGFIDDESKLGTQETDKWKFTMDDVAAQSILFYAGGFETSSTVTSFALYELALNQDIQKRLHEEVDATLKEHGGQFTYEALVGMKYLDKVVAETMRKYPPAGLIDRKCTRDFQLPGGGPRIEKGMVVVVPVYAIHHDPEYYPEPQRFDPERFSEEQKATRHPYVYMPFGEGPRNCIGMRLGLLQTKTGVAYMMSKYEVRRCEETVVPLQFTSMSGVLTPTAGIKLKLVQRK
ncbi:cytochrome P450 6k1-like [Schistocerca americana]|uniref:cytochrome P450 6k1-like n=1 Tax=Schistocerca americana TaxID=7009 RepID=UPI001F4FC191|nr:cytochrome P450 6k1-like [Schistocerca americana]